MVASSALLRYDGGARWHISLPSEQLLALHDAVVATFSRAEWHKLGLLSGELDYINSHERLLRSLDFGDDDYSGHALRVIKRFTEGPRGIWALLQIPKLRDWLAREKPATLAALEHLSPQTTPQVRPNARQILALSEGIKQTFCESDWIKLGIVASCSDVIENHPRLLRSLRFGDNDYEGWVMEILGLLERQGKPLQEVVSGFQKLKDWLDTNHADVAQSLWPSSIHSTIAPPSSSGVHHPPPTSPSVLQPALAIRQPVLNEPAQPVATELSIADLMTRVQAISAGRENASAYHRAVGQ